MKIQIDNRHTLHFTTSSICVLSFHYQIILIILV